MCEFQITDADLVGALCSARANSWQRSVEKAKARTALFGGGYYRDFVVKGNFDDADNETLDKHLGRFTEWQNESYDEILVEILNSSDECKRLFIRRVKRFLMALKEMLADIVDEKRYRIGRYCSIAIDEQAKLVLERRLEHIRAADELRLQDVKGTMFDEIFEAGGDIISGFLANEFEKGGRSVLTLWPLSERFFIERILVFQELLRRLSVEHSKQTEEPAAVDGAADRQLIGWRGDQHKLTELAEELQTRGYIKYSQWFVERFSSDCPPDVDGWSGAANNIVYLLEQLQERKLFVHVPQSRLESVFRIKGYKSKKDGYGRNNAEKPKMADEIDRILSSVFPDS